MNERLKQIEKDIAILKEEKKRLEAKPKTRNEGYDCGVVVGLDQSNNPCIGFKRDGASKIVDYKTKCSFRTSSGMLRTYAKMLNDFADEYEAWKL